MPTLLKLYYDYSILIWFNYLTYRLEYLDILNELPNYIY